MSKNPVKNALMAELYILFVVGVLSWGSKFQVGKEDSFFAPMAMISLFTLSAGMMSYIFGLEPIQMYLDGKKKEAVNLFLKTLMFFGVITMGLVVFVFFRTGR